MPYDDKLATRVRALLSRRKGVSERAMFGGLAFMLNGNMCCGVVGDTLMLRLGEAGAARALGEKHARPMDFTGRPLKSMVYVAPAGLRTEAALRGWVDRAVAFARTLPAK
jgi:TfoX/Sxy family transcriptional regulator of competence genes